MNDSANLFLEKIETLELQIETLESKVISLEEKNSEYIKEISNRFIKIES
jgi:chaperonin cofactor prefoldin